MHLEVAYAALPELLAGEIERGGEDGAVVEEVDEQALAVADHIGRGLRGDFMAFGVEVAAMDDGFPLLLSCGAVIAEHELLFGFHVCRREVHLICHDGWRAMASAAHFGLPQDVFTFVPFQRELLPRRCMTIHRRTAPRWPVCGEERSGEKRGGKEQDVEVHVVSKEQ